MSGVTSLLDLVRRSGAVAPWQHGDNIPWHQPDFSERMLQEHLSQDHDAASRRADTIDAHIDWIHDHLLKGHAAKILDLGCGPGLYTSRLAQRGHECLGIDFSPASIAYATDHARARARSPSPSPCGVMRHPTCGCHSRTRPRTGNSSQESPATSCRPAWSGA